MQGDEGKLRCTMRRTKKFEGENYMTTYNRKAGRGYLPSNKNVRMKLVMQASNKRQKERNYRVDYEVVVFFRWVKW